MKKETTTVGQLASKLSRTLYLKTGVKLTVKVGTSVENSGFIEVYESYDDKELLYTISRTSSAGINCLLPKGKERLQWSEITEIAEITENFGHYFNNLNQ